MASSVARSIGGKLDYRALAILHRPADPDALAAEARALPSRGLRSRTWKFRYREIRPLP